MCSRLGDGCRRTIRKTSSQARSNRLLSEFRSKSSQGVKRTHDLAAPNPGLEVFWNDAAKVRRPVASAQTPAVSHACLRPGSRVQAATGMDQRNGPAGTCGNPRASSLIKVAGKSNAWRDVGWGTWIRTKIDGVRVRSSTVELSPNDEWSVAKRRVNSGGAPRRQEAREMAPARRADALGPPCIRRLID